MNILVVSQYYYPEQFKINDICESLVDNGHSVTVLTGLPNYPSGIISDNYKLGKNRREVVNGVKVERCFLTGRGKGSIQLGLNYLSFMCSSSLKITQLKDKFDIVFVYQLSPVFMAIPGIIYRKKHNVPLYLYCLDLWPESLKVNIKNENNLIYKCVESFSKFIYKKCDLIGVTSKPFIKYLSRVHGIKLNKLSYLPQHGYDTYANLSNESNMHTGINVSYFGNIGKVQNFDIIIKNIDKVNSDITFHIIGDGSEFASLKQKIEAIQLSQRIVLHGYKQKDELVKLYNITDICLLSLKSDSSVGDTLPSKMIEYLSVNKPILAIAKGSVKELINEIECGYCVDIDDDVDFIEKINLLSTNSNLRIVMGKKGRQYFEENFTKEMFIDKLEKQFTKLLEE
jgi:glycosyltransferase involved in cell wall biosynthesis